MKQEELQKELEGMAQKDYKKFSASLLPGVKNLLGIRLPQLRKMAKEMADEDWKYYLSWENARYFEEVMLQGMILGYAKAPVTEILEYTERFIPKIDNWSVNDSFCTTFRSADKYPGEVWDFLMKYQDSHQEFEVRMVAVMLMSHYLKPDYIQKVFEVLTSLDATEYYASMAVAWAFATAWAKFPDETRDWLAAHSIEKKTYRRMLQKCIESRRIKDEDKQWMRMERSLDKSGI